MVGFTEHKAYLYRLGFSEKDIYALQDEYMKKLEGNDEKYNSLVEEFKEKYPKLDILKWERYVEVASELGSMVDFVKPFIPYAVGGKIDKKTNTRNFGKFQSPEAKIIFSDRGNKSIPEKETIGRDSWDSNIRPTPNEADAAFQIIVNFMKKTGLEPLKVEDLPLGEQSIKPLVLTLKTLADRGAEYGKGNLELRVRALISSDISNITNLTVPEYGETVNIGQATTALANKLKEAEGKSIPKDYLETLKLVFNPNVVRQLPAEVRQNLENYFSTQVRGKPLSFWLSRVVASNVNLRELTSNISVTDKVNKPIGFGRPEGVKEESEGIKNKLPSQDKGIDQTQDTAEIVINEYIKRKIPQESKNLVKKVELAFSKSNPYKFDKIKREFGGKMPPRGSKKYEEIKRLEERMKEGKDELTQLKPLVEKYNKSIESLIKLAEETFGMKITGKKYTDINIIGKFEVTDKGSLSVQEVRDIIRNTLKKMDVEDLPPKQRKRVKTYMQDADPTEYFGEEYLKLGKIINILEGIVTPEDEKELAELDEDNLKLVKLAARLRKHYETLYAALGDMVYDREEEE